VVHHSERGRGLDEDGVDLTSFHVRRAREGEQESLSWVVSRFTPFLRVQAEYRVRGGLQRHYDPEDLVNEVWAIVLPRIDRIREQDGHCTPVFLKYLASTLLNRVNDHLTRYLRTDARRSMSAGGLPAVTTSVMTAAERSEACEMLYEALQQLEPDERELLVLRGIEQHPNRDVARRIGSEPSTVTKRYQRLLKKLRGRLPCSILDELTDA